MLRSFWWDDDALGYIDQRRLPGDVVHASATDVGAVIDANLVVGNNGFALPCNLHRFRCGFRAARFARRR